MQALEEFCKVIYTHMGVYVDALLKLTLPLMTTYSNPTVCRNSMDIWSSFIEEYTEQGSNHAKNHINQDLAKQLAQVFMNNMCVVTK